MGVRNRWDRMPATAAGSDCLMNVRCMGTTSRSNPVGRMAALADQLPPPRSEASGACCVHPPYAWKSAARWCLTASTNASSRTSS